MHPTPLCIHPQRVEEHNHTHVHTHAGREQWLEPTAEKQTDREMSKSSQDESCMQIVLLTVSFPPHSPLYHNRDTDTEQETQRGGERKRVERKERIVSSHNRVDWRGPY